MAVSYRCICNLEADLYKVLAGGGGGVGEQGGVGGVPLRLKACHLDFQNIPQNRLCTHFTGALKTRVLLLQFSFKLVNENTKSISRALCNWQTVKLSPTSCYFI